MVGINMFSKILGKKQETTSQEDQEKAELLEKISTMNLTEMKSYVNNKRESLPLNEDGLHAVIQKLVTPHASTQALYIQESDMDSKKKKAFDLVLLIAKSKKITFKTVDEIQKFIQTYTPIIQAYDTEYKEIYTSRFSDAITLALANMQTMSNLKAKMDILDQNN